MLTGRIDLNMIILKSSDSRNWTYLILIKKFKGISRLPNTPGDVDKKLRA